jgi:hypothetical protein
VNEEIASKVKEEPCSDSRPTPAALKAIAENSVLTLHTSPEISSLAAPNAVVENSVLTPYTSPKISSFFMLRLWQLLYLRAFGS